MGLGEVFYSKLVVFWEWAFYFSLVGISLFFLTQIVLFLTKKKCHIKTVIFYYQFFFVNIAFLLAVFSTIEFSIFNYSRTNSGMGIIIFSDHPNFGKDILLLVFGPVIFLGIAVLPAKIYWAIRNRDIKL